MKKLSEWIKTVLCRLEEALYGEWQLSPTQVQEDTCGEIPT